jgi:hypothetical protein
MIKIENTEVFGWEAAIRGMRNPMNSWDRSDSYYGCELGNCSDGGDCVNWYECYGADSEFVIGENDLKLMQNLAKAGRDHAKYLRMINVTFDCTAPLYFYKEFDTYKIGSVANSCSTMHKIHAKEFTLDDFSYEHLSKSQMDSTELVDTDGNDTNYFVTPKGLLKITIGLLNNYRKRYLETKDKKYWWQMIQLLPSSYNQKRTVQLNYAVLWNMYCARKNHKLDEWREFCKWCEGLPYFKEVLLDV